MIPAKITDIELYAWIGEDEFGSGKIGLKQGIVPAGHIPIVVMDYDLHKIAKSWPQAEAQAKQSGKRIYLCRFTLAEIVQYTQAGGEGS